jgi:hypothetical protein
MTDFIDQLTDREENILLLKIRTRPAPPTNTQIAGTGFCLVCDAPVEHGRWCDDVCRKEWSENQ